MDTVARFSKLLRKVGICKAEIPFICSDLINAYQEPGRFYHNLNHVTSCLEELDSFVEKQDWLEPESINAIELAIFYHDYVYDPFSKINEKESAVQAARDLSILEVKDCYLIDRVFNTIILTEHRYAVEENFMAVMTDIDLSILGKNTRIFSKYNREIRLEYQAVEDSVYKENRKIFLEGMLNRRRKIFCLEYFQNKYEERARYNIKNAIEELSKKDSRQK